MSASRGRAVWNEVNLAENEQIKAELNTTKIDEPKTPYHAPIDEDIGNILLCLPSCLVRVGCSRNRVLCAEMEPLDLNNPVAPQAAPEYGSFLRSPFLQRREQLSVG